VTASGTKDSPIDLALRLPGLLALALTDDNPDGTPVHPNAWD
jgi:hypothetical protein